MRREKIIPVSLERLREHIASVHICSHQQERSNAKVTCSAQGAPASAETARPDFRRYIDQIGTAAVAGTGCQIEARKPRILKHRQARTGHRAAPGFRGCIKTVENNSQRQSMQPWMGNRARAAAARALHRLDPVHAMDAFPSNRPARGIQKLYLGNFAPDARPAGAPGPQDPRIARLAGTG